MDLNHKFSGEIIGMGEKIAIPDLNHDGVYGLSSFRAAGYRWLVAVPLMTYRVYGILGTACRNKKSYDKNTTGLIMVVASLIANALSKAELTRNFQPQSKPVTPPAPSLEAVRAKDAPLLGGLVKKPVKSAPPQDAAPPENDDDDVLARLLKNKRASTAAPLATAPEIKPAEDLTEKTPLRPVKVSRPPSLQQSPPLPDRPASPPHSAADAPAVKKPQKQTGPAHSSHPRKITSFREAHRKK
jgi:hypothetical protein